MTHGFPNFFFPGGPHGAAGNNPRYGELQVIFVQDIIDYARAHGLRRIEVPKEDEQAWMDMIAQFAALLAVPEAGPVLRRQHPRQAEGVPAQPGRQAEA